jgi:hypothetical protein
MKCIICNHEPSHYPNPQMGYGYSYKLCFLNCNCNEWVPEDNLEYLEWCLEKKNEVKR